MAFFTKTLFSDNIFHSKIAIWRKIHDQDEEIFRTLAARLRVVQPPFVCHTKFVSLQKNKADEKAISHNLCMYLCYAA